MKLVLSTHNVTLTKAIEEHILDKLEKLEHLDQQAIDARVTLEHTHTKDFNSQWKCAVRLTMPGPDLYAEDAEKDLYVAIDLVTKKLEQQLRKRHSKFKAKKQTEGARRKRKGQAASDVE